MFAYLIARACFYAIVFAWLGWGPDRYMDACAPVAILGVSLTIVLAINSLRRNSKDQVLL
jgi:hypothetical protein